jgi:hypothetical protein
MGSLTASSPRALIAALTQALGRAMLRLTDSQLHVLINAAAPIYPADRDAFVRDIARALDGRLGIGEGEFYRIVKAAQLKHHPRPSCREDYPRDRGEAVQAIPGAAGSEIAPPAEIIASARFPGPAHDLPSAAPGQGRLPKRPMGAGLVRALGPAQRNRAVWGRL